MATFAFEFASYTAIEGAIREKAAVAAAKDRMNIMRILTTSDLKRLYFGLSR